MEVRAWISEASFNDGSKVKFSKDQLTIFVGPNNVGKSKVLSELATLMRFPTKAGIIAKKIEIRKIGNDEKLVEFIRENSIVSDNTNNNAVLTGYQYSFRESDAKSSWRNEGLAAVFPYFVNLLKTEDRLKLVEPPENISLNQAAPKHPIHFLQRNDDLEIQFSNYFKQAFQEELIVHRNAGSKVPLYIGERPTPRKGEDRISRAYLDEIEKLPLLHEQGDGMRSFVGVLLSSFVSKQNILFIDEPDAFLHPPQARLLGKMLSKDLPKDKQLFVATHSGDFLKGLLESNTSNLQVIRIKREDTINKFSILDTEEINDVWQDSLLRHSNILDGLFHSKVVICESDSDCRFYSAVLRSSFEKEGNISPDILFTHCGGKHRVNMVIKALQKLEVDINTILDFDILNSKEPLKSIYEELGGDWSDLDNDWQIIKKSIERINELLPEGNEIG